ncbi:hypothetical protein F4780DRAFT_152553 [Xylariomycetidae sp. FL0641]|nr:hypothetical protein F4780DRAFT_152553 [Xylariomycetidae sp. FL0641]
MLPSSDVELSLTYPLATGDELSELPRIDSEPMEGNASPIPGLLAGILIPHMICTLFIFARVVSRLVYQRRWFLDDSLISVAWVSSTVISIVYSLATERPGIKDANITPDGPITPYLLRTYLGLIFYQLCLSFTKLSILVFYLRVLPARTPMKWVAVATMGFVAMYGIPLLLMSIFQCYPVAGEFFGRPMRCLELTPLLISSASLHTSTDAWLIFLIIPVVNRLDLPSKQKVAVSIVLSLSIFVIAAGMIRLQLSLQRGFRPSHGVQGSNTLAFFVMTVLECDIAMICASAPTLRPLLAGVWPQFMDEMPARHDDSSIDLPTVVRYHGYPWTEYDSDYRSGSGILMGTRRQATIPRRPTSPHHTITSHSLRSKISGKLPRSRGRFDPDAHPILSKYEEDLHWKRGSAAFEGYEQQHQGYSEGRSRFKGEPIQVIGARRQWSNSQESFISPTDPASPRTLRSWTGSVSKGDGETGG